MKSRPKKDKKTIFLSVEQFIAKTQFEKSKYLLSIFMSSNISVWAVMEDLFNSSPKHLWSEGKRKKTWLDWDSSIVHCAYITTDCAYVTRHCTYVTTHFAYVKSHILQDKIVKDQIIVGASA